MRVHEILKYIENIRLVKVHKSYKERNAKASWVFHSIINVCIYVFVLNVIRSYSIHNCCKDANQLSIIAKKKVIVRQKKKGKHKKRG